MTQLTISIDRASKRIAIFNGFECIGGFKSYTDEAEAEKEARSIVATLSKEGPEIVYPRIDSIRMTQRRVKR